MTDDGPPLDLAQTKEEAEPRYIRFVSKDPFPDIAPALLNSADIYDYVRATGMVVPFEPDPAKGKLKSASYEVDFLGDLHLVNAGGKYEVKAIEVGQEYELPRNSIAFLFLATTFRLPDYIAARFNLRITLVHTGLLLGTGPLIDPGFAGRLLIPLHNLTSENYPIKGGEGVIWIEFTKLSVNERWSRSPSYERTGEYRPFPDDRRCQDAEQYLKRAARPGKLFPARSSIPGEIRIASRSASEARKFVRLLSGIGIVAIVAVFVGVAALGYQVYALIQDAGKNVADATKAISDYREHQNAIENKLGSLENQMKCLESVNGLRSESNNPAIPRKLGASKGLEKAQ